MAQYMVNINLPEYMSEDFITLIPDQKAYVDRLMGDGTITSYSLSMDKSKLWVTMNAKSESLVSKTIRNFPIIDFIEYDITELAFFNNAQVFFPSLSLN